MLSEIADKDLDKVFFKLVIKTKIQLKMRGVFSGELKAQNLSVQPNFFCRFALFES